MLFDINGYLLNKYLKCLDIARFILFCSFFDVKQMFVEFRTDSHTPQLGFFREKKAKL